MGKAERRRINIHFKMKVGKIEKDMSEAKNKV